MPISSTAEYFEGWKAGKSEPYIRGENWNDTATKPASLCAIYKIQGPLEDQYRGETYYLAVWYTYFLAEALDPIFIPISIYQRRKLSKDYSYLTFWYDKHGKFVRYYEGNIRTAVHSEPGAP